jgi:hypothetical protein
VSQRKRPRNGRGRTEFPLFWGLLIANFIFLLHAGILFYTSHAPTSAPGSVATDLRSVPPAVGVANLFFYVGLILVVLGLAIGHLNILKFNFLNSFALIRQKPGLQHLIALTLIDSCALMGSVLLQIGLVETSRAQSMMVVSLLGIGSLLISIQKYVKPPEPK